VPPDKALATFKMVEGLELSLWASEPLFANPTCMDIDHKGRVWVCESINYRCTLHGQRPKRPEGDRILILEDTKGSGSADKVTVFYQAPEILAPLGIAVAKDPTGPGYKVFVCQSPDILLFEDKDGDGKADGPPKKLLTGFAGIDHDHGVHGILIGPDGKLYFSVGDQGVRGLQASDGKGRKWTSNNTDCRAGTIWRCNLDGTNLELIAHNFRNEYEPCVDSFGTVFVSDNDDDGNEQTRICYVMPGGNYGYHPRGPNQTHWHEEQPGVVPKILRTYFGSPTGICVYEGALLPEKYRGQLLHTDAGPRHLRCYHLTSNGASYAVDREDMLTSTDTWFRPSDVCVGPDGSVYVADWYDPGVGGHGIGDFTRGRIYRVAPQGNKPSLPTVDLESQAGLTAALASPALSVRYMAMAKLEGMDRKDALAVLDAAALQKESPVLRARALWQLARLGSLKHVVEASRDPDPRIRCLVLRIRKDYAHESPADYDDVMCDAVLKDGSAMVRREALLALRDVDPAKASPLILELARRYDGSDRFYLEALGIAVGQDKARRAVLLPGLEKLFTEWSDKVADLTWELRPPGLLPALEERLQKSKGAPDQAVRLIEVLGAYEDIEAGRALLRSLAANPPQAVRERIIDHLKVSLAGKWRELRQGPELSDALTQLFAQAGTRSTAVALVRVADRTDLLGKVTELAANPREPLALRTSAIQALAGWSSSEAVKALVALLSDWPAAGPARNGC
jgi:putative membrane-bound dehydrogenase-like protein